MITARERVQACLAGERTDRTPVALWRHFPVDDQRPETLAAAHLTFQRTYNFDLVKVTPASSFCLRDWGAEDEWRGAIEGTRQYTERVVQKPADWEQLPVLAPDAAHLADQLQCLGQLRTGLGPDIPMLQTVFSPLAQAKNLAGGERLLAHLRQYPEAVQRGLQTIAESTRRFVEAARSTGIDGIFYAVQHAQAGLLSRAEFHEFSLQLDLKVLEEAQGLWCNMLHVHGLEVYFDLMTDYPVQIINWHDRETPPSLAQARSQFKGTLCGGLDRETLTYGDADQVRLEAQDAVQQTGGRKLILSTGCVVPVIAPSGNLAAVQ